MPLVRALTALLVLSLATSCKSAADEAKAAATKQKLAELKARVSAELAKQAKPPPLPEPVRPQGVPPSSGEPEGEPAPPPEASTPLTAKLGAANPDFIADEAVTVGAPGPATASPLGAVLFTRDATLAVARLGALSTSKAPARTPMHALPGDAGPFGLAFGPGLFQDYAYWISQGRLVRRRIKVGEAVGALEVLANDAHDGTRVAVPIPKPDSPASKIPATVAYIQKPKAPKPGEENSGQEQPLQAILWVEGSPSEGLTAEGNSTHSVSLVRTDDGVIALSVQARMAMTPVHYRKITLASGRPIVGDDLVVWVGGGIQPLTEMTVLAGTGKDLWGFIPHERTMREFGLAQLDITTAPSMDTKVDWLVYPNGIDPAPVAAANVCGKPVVVYAAPTTKAPDAPQALWLRALSNDAANGAEPLQVASDRVFYFTSVATVPGGALVVWVTNGATRAATVRCTKGRK